MRSREQRLIDIMFEMVIRMQMGDIYFKNRETAGAYVADQLRACGFNTAPVGMSWGVLKTHDMADIEEAA